MPELSDTGDIIALHTRSWLDTYPNDENGVSREYIAEYVKRFSSNEGRERRNNYIREVHKSTDYYFCIGCNENGKVIGFVDARREGDKRELSGLYIAKEYYGSGLGYDLAKGAIDWLGVDNDITLHVVTYNGRAKRFYQKLGFEEVAGTERFRTETIIPIIDMIKRVEHD